MRRTIHAWDTRLLTRLGGRHHHGVDRLMRELSRSADHGKLWMASALLLWLTKDPRARRGALHGLLALAISSPLVNGPLKALARRARPAGILGMPRLLGRYPTSRSFPSGHSASAGAFATAVLLAGPAWVAAPIAAISIGVAWSRAHVGVHYPSDVVAGYAIGAAVAVGVERIASAYERDVTVIEARDELHQQVHDDPHASTGQGVTMVINSDAGSASPELVKQITAALPDADIQLHPGDDVEQALEEAAQSAHALGVCGGDGTVRSAAAIAQRHRVPLVPLPGGTLNYFCRDLQMGQMDTALERAQQAGDGELVDLAMAADYPFINAAFLGNYADLIERREPLEAALGKWPAFVVALAITLRKSEPVRIKLDGKPLAIWLMFIGNCEYYPVDFLPLSRAKFADGKFDVRIFRAKGPLSKLRLFLAVAAGRPQWSRAYERRLAETLTIESAGGQTQLDWVLDGEPQSIRGQVRVHKAATPFTVFGR